MVTRSLLVVVVVLLFPGADTASADAPPQCVSLRGCMGGFVDPDPGGPAPTILTTSGVCVPGDAWFAVEAFLLALPWANAPMPNSAIRTAVR